MPDTTLEGGHPRIISAKFGSVVSEEKIFWEIHIRIFPSETTGPIVTKL
jgi:hypothetical protein